jgi:hypothetical protein
MCRCRGMRGIIRVGVESKGLWEQGSWYSAWNLCGLKFASSYKGLLPQ